ncbi:MAG: CoA-transferase [Armatimonadota bacterium]|nr:CoA-transferase [Armatimonadota bacterium]MDR7534582.1 CoA-transferase [Armatimonadota bacterium]MDR7535032.1 CoA-transferase [Armatimonadota bacterium]
MAVPAAARTAPKVMTAAEAVARFVRPGSVLGMGGQNIGRCPQALTHEIIRQRIGGLTVVGCNLSIGMDQLVGAGLVRRTESGSGNLERFGVTFCWRRGIEDGTLEHEDYSHLAMVSRFLAGEMGVPFMPTRSLLGSDMLGVPPAGAAPHGGRGAAAPGADTPAPRGPGKAVVVDNPWAPGEPVVLVPALQPDVSIVHVQRADPLGNLVIEGFATHEPEMLRASRAVVVSCEELISTDEIRAAPERTTVPFMYVDAVVVQPFGAYPTSVYGHYDYDALEVARYQEAARAGPAAVDAYLQATVWDCPSFDDYLARTAGPARLAALRAAMREVL